MKPLQNPVVVTVLVIVALAFVFRGFFAPIRDRLFSSSVSKQAAAPPPFVVDSSATNTSASATNVLEHDIPWKKTESATPEWVKVPHRDPFQFVPLPDSVRLVATTNKPGLSAPVKTAQEVLALKAIWLQTGGQLAVLNDKIVGEGSSIQDYTVEKIEADKVWVSGPLGQERVLFGVGTNAPPATNPPPINLPRASIPANNAPDTHLSRSDSKN